jgi:hypothetical protein
VLSRNSKAYSSLPRTTARPTIIFTTEHIRAEFTFKTTPRVEELQTEVEEKVAEEPKVEIKETETPLETPKVRMNIQIYLYNFLQYLPPTLLPQFFIFILISVYLILII